MAVQTGRTVSKWVKVQVRDSGSALRDLPVDSINGVGLTYDEVDLTAWLDTIKGVLPNTPGTKVTITGPFDTTTPVTASVSAAHAALSGSHPVLSGIAVEPYCSTPRTLAVYIGMRHDWETGEPVWGISSSTATNGFVLLKYEVDVNAGKYSAEFGVAAGSAAPAWGTAVLA